MDQLFASRDLQLHADLADLLELLSIALTNPTRDLACALTDGSYFSDLSACLTGVSSALDAEAARCALRDLSAAPAYFAVKDAEALFHEINQEFTRLFIAPQHEQTPLYESLIVHRDDKKASMFINPTCMHCEQEYKKHGFPFPEKGKTPGDHIAIELRYLAFLISGRIGALTAEDERAAASVDGLIRDFTKTHIRRWLHSFAAELSGTANHPFYQRIAKVCLLIEPLLTNAV